MSGTQQRSGRQDAPDLKRLKRKVTALAVAGALGGFLFGFDSSVVNGAVDAIGKQFDLSPALATRLGVEGTQEIRWRFAVRG